MRDVNMDLRINYSLLIICNVKACFFRRLLKCILSPSRCSSHKVIDSFGLFVILLPLYDFSITELIFLFLFFIFIFFFFPSVFKLSAYCFSFESQVSITP